jgi:uncharacterized protein
MTKSAYTRATAFAGLHRLATGPIDTVAQAVVTAFRRQDSRSILMFDDATGQLIDLDFRGSDADILRRLPLATDAGEPVEVASERRGRGRPKLGVVAREVTLLPRHWEWLATQPGGASIALRKLVEQARHQRIDEDLIRRRRDRAYRFMAAMAGDLPGFEEACRALFADDRARFDQCIAGWPADIRAYADRLAFGPDGAD